LEDNRRRGKIFSKRVRFSERANKDIGLKGSVAIRKGVYWEYHVRYSSIPKKERSERYGL